MCMRKKSSVIIPRSSETALKAVTVDETSTEIEKLLEEYLQAEPCEDFGMIPARCSRDTVPVRRKK